jgi:hypothetical protein
MQNQGYIAARGELVGGGEVSYGPPKKRHIENVGGTPAQPAPVDVSLDSLQSMVDIAHSELEALVQRLEPVLSVRPECAGNETIRAPATCIVDRRITNSKDGIATLADKIRSIRESLCI